MSFAVLFFFSFFDFFLLLSLSKFNYYCNYIIALFYSLSFSFFIIFYVIIFFIFLSISFFKSQLSLFILFTIIFSISFSSSFAIAVLLWLVLLWLVLRRLRFVIVYRDRCHLLLSAPLLLFLYSLHLLPPLISLASLLYSSPLPHSHPLLNNIQLFNLQYSENCDNSLYLFIGRFARCLLLIVCCCFVCHFCSVCLSVLTIVQFVVLCLGWLDAFSFVVRFSFVCFISFVFLSLNRDFHFSINVCACVCVCVCNCLSRTILPFHYTCVSLCVSLCVCVCVKKNSH